MAHNKPQTEALRFRNKLSYDLMEEIPNSWVLELALSIFMLRMKHLTILQANLRIDLFTSRTINKNYLKDYGLDI